MAKKVKTKSRSSNHSRKKQLLWTVGAIIGFFYLLAIFYYIHLRHIMLEKPGTGLLEQMDLALTDCYTHPFSLFPLPSGVIRDVFIVTVVIVLMGVIMYIKESTRRHYNVKKVMGDAAWFDDFETYDIKFADPIGKPGHDGQNNLILSENTRIALQGAPNRNMNMMLIGGSGSGKSYFVVGPNIMQANCSYVVTDPSGGLYAKYGWFLEYMGYRVKCFNLEHMERGNRYNPFNYIKDDKDIEVLVTTLIQNTTPPEKKGGDDFWEKCEVALLVALIAFLYHYCTPDMQNFSNVMALMRKAEISEEDSTQTSPLDALFLDIERKYGETFAVKQYKTFKMGAGKTLKSILISCAVRLQAFDLINVARLTDTDDIDLETVGDVKTAIFIIIPTGEITFNFLASMMYSQLFQVLYGYAQNTAEFSQLVMDSNQQIWQTFRAKSMSDAERAKAAAELFLDSAKDAVIVENPKYHWFEIRSASDQFLGYRGTHAEAEEALNALRGGKVISNSEQSNDGRRVPIHVRFLLDEFPNTGKIPAFSEKVATIRKYELSTLIVVQSLQQMKNLYKDDWETITGNCDNTIYLGGGADTVTGEWISKLLGKETRIVMNTSFGKGGGSTSFNRSGVELFALDQLRTMPEDECIIMPKSLNAIRDKKFNPSHHRRFDLVNALYKKNGSYQHSPDKTRYLITQTLSQSAIIATTHGEVIADRDGEIRRKKLQQVKECAAEEAAKNEDAGGQKLIDEIRKIEPSDGALKDTMPIPDSTGERERFKRAVQEALVTYAEDELIYSSAQSDFA